MAVLVISLHRHSLRVGGPQHDRRALHRGHHHDHRVPQDPHHHRRRHQDRQAPQDRALNRVLLLVGNLVRLHHVLLVLVVIVVEIVMPVLKFLNKV